MMKNILGCACSSAQISANKLVLSLPDAMTPVMWVIDLDDSKTILLKVQQAEHNTYVLQKINRSGQKDSTVEDIAVYDSKGKAIRALNRTNEALSRQSSGCANRSLAGCIWYWVKMALAFVVLMTIVVYWMLGSQFGTSILLKMLDMQGKSSTTTTASAPANPENNFLSMPSTPFMPQSPSALSDSDVASQLGVMRVSPASTNPDAVGVPLSADELISKNKSLGF